MNTITITVELSDADIAATGKSQSELGKELEQTVIDKVADLVKQKVIDEIKSIVDNTSFNIPE